MPLVAPINRDFNGGTVGQTVPTPTDVVLGGTAPIYATGHSGTAAKFQAASGVGSLYQDVHVADSDFSQFSGKFKFDSVPDSNIEISAGLNGSSITDSLIILTSGGTLMRDGAGGSTITGWTNVTLAVNTWYGFQIAVQRGTTTSNGIIKVQLVRMSDGVVLASGFGEACNTGTVSPRGRAYGKRSTGGSTANVTWDDVRTSNQAMDLLPLAIPAAQPAETPVPGASSLAFVGDSTTDRGGAGPAQVKAAILANGKGWVSAQVQVNGLTSRTINYDNGVHPTGVEQVDVFRAGGYDAGTWVMALGGNGGGSPLAQQKIWISDFLNKVAEGSLPTYKVVVFGFTRRDPADALAATFWQALNETTVVPSKVTLVKVDLNSIMHNGRDETGFWQSTSPTEAHMTAAGYAARDAMMAPYISPPDVVAPTIPAGALEARLRALATASGAAIKARSPKVDLVSRINWSEIQVVAHRNGPSIWPEASMEGALDVVNTGQIHLEVDLQTLADGTFVCCHDATVDRTMENIGTGNVSTKTRAQWRGASIKPAIQGGAYGTPMFWSDVLDRFGGNVLILPELKAADTTGAHAFAQDIVARGLTKAIIGQSFDYAICQIIASYGIPTMFLSTNQPTQTTTQMLADGIAYLGTSTGGASPMTQAQITTFKSAGVKVFLYTVSSLAQYTAAAAKTPNGVFSNDPWWHTGLIRKQGQDPFGQGIMPKGARYFQPAGASGPATDSPDKLMLLGNGAGFTVAKAAPSLRFLDAPWAGRTQTNKFIVRMAIQFGTEGTSQAAGIGGVLWMNTANADGEWADSAVTGQNGFTWQARRSGQIQLWKYTAGAAAVSLGAFPTTAPAAGAAGEFAPAGKTGRVNLVFQHDGTTATLTASMDSNAAPISVAVADTSTWTGLRFGIRWLTPGFVSDVGITELLTA